MQSTKVAYVLYHSSRIRIDRKECNIRGVMGLNMAVA